MAAAQMTNELLLETVALIEEHGSMNAAARASGIPRCTLQNRIQRAAARGLMGTETVLPGFEIRKTTEQTGKDGEVEREWVTQAPEKGDIYGQLPDGMLLDRITVQVAGDGRLERQWLKGKAESGVADLVVALKAAFEGYEGHATEVPYTHVSDENLLSVYPIADQHVGLLAWGPEAGEDYDLKIGVARLRECMKRLVSQSDPSRTAIILNLGDWQHTDDQKNITPGHGHQLDVDSRYAKILTAGVQLMMDCIELALAKHEHVIVRNLPGNHDPHSSIALTIALGAFYASNPRVTIDDDPSDFFYHRFGVTLMGATHGHKMKPDKMAMALATRCREDWGATDYHWFMFGHIHHETAKEVGDVRIESFQTLAAKDAYAAGGGYNAGQSLQCITLHRTEGEIGRHRVNLPIPKSYRKAVRSS